MKRPKVVLYNPRADFATFPLALLALASALDRKRYQVVIVNGRMEERPSRESYESYGRRRTHLFWGHGSRDSRSETRFGSRAR